MNLLQYNNDGFFFIMIDTIIIKKHSNNNNVFIVKSPDFILNNFNSIPVYNRLRDYIIRI
jgi:hypothetical protein